MDETGADWEERLRRLEPPDRVVARAILSGADAASCSVLERDGRVGFTTITGDGATAIVKVRPPGTDEEWVRLMPLALVPRLAAQGADIVDVSASDPDVMTWTAGARVTTGTQPPGRAEPPDRHGPSRWLLVAHDDRGLGAAPLSAIPMPNGRPLGGELARTLTRTNIEGAAGRMRAAREKLAGDLQAVVASGAAMYLAAVPATTGADGGPPTHDWQLLRCPLAGGPWTVVAGTPSMPAISRSSRRGNLFSAILKEAQADAFGTGIHSPRSKRVVTSLDEPIGEDATETLGGSLAGALDLGSALEVDDLLTAARLTKREREVLELQFVDGLTQAAIADRLGIAPGTVAALSSRAAKKVPRGPGAT